MGDCRIAGAGCQINTANGVATPDPAPGEQAERRRCCPNACRPERTDTLRFRHPKHFASTALPICVAPKAKHAPASRMAAKRRCAAESIVDTTEGVPTAQSNTLTGTEVRAGDRDILERLVKRLKVE